MRYRSQWNDGAPAPAFLTNFEAPPIAQRHICSGGGSPLDAVGSAISSIVNTVAPLFGVGGTFLGDAITNSPINPTQIGIQTLGGLAGESGLGSAIGSAFGDAVGGASDFGFADLSGAFGGLGDTAAPTAGDFGASAFGEAGPGLGFSFGDLSGAFGGLGGTPAPTAGDFTSLSGAAPAGGAAVGGAAGVGGGPAASPAAGLTTTSFENPFGGDIGGSAPGVGGGSPGFASGQLTATPSTFGEPSETVANAAPGATNAPDLASPLGDSTGFTAPFAPADVLGRVSDYTAGNQGFFGNLASKIGDYVGNHPFQAAGTALGAANIFRQLLSSNNIDVNALTAAQKAAFDRIQALSQQLTQGGGQLTPEQAQQFANDLQAIQSAITARYTSKGQAPNSTSVMEDLAAAQAQNTAGKANAMSQNLRTGLTAAGMTPQFANQLLSYQLSQDAGLNQMLARLAAAGIGSNA